MGIDGSATIKITFTCSNPKWFNVMQEGLGPQEVTGTVELPQGGQRESRAAVIGGVYQEAAEPPSPAYENGTKILNSTLGGIVSSHLQGNGFDLASTIGAIEFFSTNLMKLEFMKTASEYMDNPDEIEATNAVIDSIQAHVTIDGSFPTMDEIRQEIVRSIRSALGGLS